jgi:ATP-binding cassette, subfamily B, bacterial MsbA
MTADAIARANDAPKTARATRKRGTLARVAADYLSPYRWRMAQAGACALVVAGSTATFAWLIGPAANRLFDPHRSTQTLIVYPLAIIAAAIVRGAAQIGQSWTVNATGHRIVGRIQVELFGKIIRSDLARIRASHSGALVASMLYDAGLVRSAATNGLITAVQNGVMVAALLVVMALRDVWLTLAILLVGPLLGAVMNRFNRWSRKAAIGGMSETSSLSTAIMEGIDGVKVVKIDNREAFEEARVAAAVDRRQGHIIRGANVSAATAPVTEIVTSVVIAGVLAYAGWRRMPVGAFFSFFTALLTAAQSLRQLSNLQPVFTEGRAAAERLFEAIDIPAEVADAPDAIALSEPARGVRLSDVSFAYHDGAPALEQVSLEVGRGETVALVGPSGGGKSTILNLIPRFYDVDAGVVSLDGHDVRGLTLQSLREQIALVTQEPFLFDDSIRANIAYARPEASAGEIEAAARAAAAHEFILALPAGYDTLVGEAGARLSGGQRQRIAIARAFLKNAPILLLDEATSALDTESEAQVQAALERLMTGRATLLIAHRLSTVKGADRIYVIDKGRVVETGTHAGLLRANGLYARLAKAQHLDALPAVP